MLHHSLLLPVEVSDRLLVLPLNKLDDVLGLADHPVVFIVELLHPQDVVGAGLLSQLQGLLDLLIRAFFKQEELFLHAFDLFFQFSDGLFVGGEIKFGGGRFTEGSLNHFFF